ncbi:MAG TPA: ABC transporter permease [Flavobacterium sp.]|nr:ABC transporter permease [Flavobacterium sp.]HQV35262.1 ABC transporter permease [Flavobacterium sp.]HQX03396.1 ABC transporter permease [Flavobacterium sp.]HRZ32264.1 ABC transporter permease [Flavobacterium sp.]HRZ74754.1 ABC transporter permease [Flavobacterium sp.]
MNFPLYIAKRYLFSGSKNTAINIITFIASAGIIVGTMALFVVLSVFSGLRDFSLSFANDFDPDLKAVAKIGKTIFITPEQENEISQLEGVANFSKIIEERALFTFNGKDQLANIKGVDQNFPLVNQVEKTIFQGQWIEENTEQVVVGYGISQKLSMGLFDLVNVFETFVPKPGKGTIDSPEGAFNRSVLVPVGFYFINEELNQKYVFANLNIVQELLDYKSNQISGFELKLKPKADESAIVESLEKIFQNNIIIKNRAQLNESLYKMLNTENLVLYLIFSLVIAVTLFTLIGALIMIIIEKKSNLKTMYSLGSDLSDLRKIFLYQGFLICLIGGIIGLFLGIVLTLLQQKFGFIMINASMAYPVRFSILNIMIVISTIAILGFLASWIASSRVNKALLE